MEGAARLRVLIADDEDSLAVAIEAILAREEIIEVVGRARDGEEAVRLARELEPDLVLMDVDMPRLDGIEATRRILAADESTRVLIVSGSDVEAHTNSAHHAGAVGFVSKSALADDLPGVVHCIASSPAD